MYKAERCSLPPFSDFLSGIGTQGLNRLQRGRLHGGIHAEYHTADHGKSGGKNLTNQKASPIIEE